MTRRLLHALLAWMIRRRVRGWVRLAGLMGIGGEHGGRLLRRNRYGVLMELDPFSYMDAVVLREGFYESEVYESIVDALPIDGVFWDIGAHCGQHAITVKTCRPDATVVAFEPSPREIAELVRGARHNQVDIQLLPLALDHETTLQTFHVCQDNHGRNCLERWGDAADYVHTLVAAVRADTLCADHGMAVPHVVKIDVEGAELRVLRGMQAILHHARCRRVVLEASPSVLQADDAIHQLLAAAGFTLRVLRRHEDTAHLLENVVADKVAVGSAGLQANTDHSASHARHPSDPP